MLEVLPDAPAMDGLFPGVFEGVPVGVRPARGGRLRSRIRRAVFGRSTFSLTVGGAGWSLAVTVRDEGGIGAVHVGVLEGKTVEHTSWMDADVRLDVEGAIDIEAVEPGRVLRISRALGSPVLTVHIRDATLSADLQLPVSTVGTTHGAHAPTRDTTTVTGWSSAVHGTLVVSGTPVELTGLKGCWSSTRGVCPRDCRYMSVSGAGVLENGRTLGVAFADGSRQGEVHEALVTLDGRLYGSERIRILLGGDVARDVWRLRSPSGELELKFRPYGSYGDDAIRRLGAAFSVRYVVGSFSGRVPDERGRTLIVKDVPGIGLDHRAG